MKTILLLVACVIPLVGTQAAIVLTEEHVDIGLNYNSTLKRWQLTARDEDNGAEYASDRAILHGSLSGQVTVPADPRYSFLGTPGATSYILPQTQEPGLLYLGFSTENKTVVIDDWTGVAVPNDFLVKGVSSGSFSGQITLTLHAVSGPGTFALYRTAPGGNPQVSFDTSNGIDASDQHPFGPNNHVHFNWAFSAPGIYEVTLQASGFLSGTNELTQSDLTTFTFEIVPEPGSVALLLGGAAIVGFHRRRCLGVPRTRVPNL